MIFWPVVIGTATVGGVLAVGLIAIGVRDWRFHRSDALQLLFDAADPLCIHRFLSPEVSGTRLTGNTLASSSPDVSIVSVSEPIGVSATPGSSGERRSQGTTVRLRVENMRKQTLARVRVKMVEVRRVRDGAIAHEHPSWLKWKDDDGPSHPASLEGRELAAGYNHDGYIDLATKRQREGQFFLNFAMDHLRDMALSAEAHDVRIVASAYDEGSGKPAPNWSATVRIDVSEDGDLLVYA